MNDRWYLLFNGARTDYDSQDEAEEAAISLGLEGSSSELHHEFDWVDCNGAVQAEDLTEDFPALDKAALIHWLGENNLCRVFNWPPSWIVDASNGDPQSIAGILALETMRELDEANSAGELADIPHTYKLLRSFLSAKMR